MKYLIIFFLLLSIQVQSQNLRPVPDINLKKALYEQGFILNDSLNLEKIKGRLQLFLNNKGIWNMDGLQYFDQVWKLEISGNNITRLDYLPPNLTDLFCSDNAISYIDNLPATLKRLWCGNNKIRIIKNLPATLEMLDFQHNAIKKLPQLPAGLQFLNYSNNPISINSLPPLFRNIPCDDPQQNCLPNELVDWNILNALKADTSFKITGMTVKISSSYSWGFGRKIELINYKTQNAQLIANEVYVNRLFDKAAQPSMNDSEYTVNVDYEVDIYRIKELINDIYSNNLLVKINTGDTVSYLNLKNKKNGENCFVGCEDCTNYHLVCTISGLADTLQLNYYFNSALSGGVTICSKNGPENIKAILDWLYAYKLTNVTMPGHEISVIFFNRKNLSKVENWLEQTEN